MAAKLILEGVQVLRRELETMIVDHTELSQKHDVMKREYKELESKYTSLDERHGDYTQLSDKHELVQCEYEELESRYKSLEKRYVECNLRLTSTSAALNTNYVELLAKYEVMSKQHVELLAKHEVMSNDHGELVSANDRLRQAHEKLGEQLEGCTCRNSGRDNEASLEIESDLLGEEFTETAEGGSVLETPDSNSSAGGLTERTLWNLTTHGEGIDLSRGSGSLAKAATLSDLHLAVHVLKLSVSRFSREFLEKLTRKSNETAVFLLERLCRGTYLSRKQHVKTYALRSQIYQVLFRGFKGYQVEADGSDHESHVFHTSSLSPTNHFEYFLTGRMHSDPKFWAFCDNKMHLFSLEFLFTLAMPEHDAIEHAYVGGPALTSSFKEACKAVWLLHMLMSAYDPPATILRISKEDKIDATTMDAVVNEEDDPNLIGEVGFMIAPGFRLGTHFIRAEVYPAGRTANPSM